ncbi:hypothetical protein BKA70DRAFT_1533993 [Coprinopsis sp. MPI-PUGE-AT-0042]|nr:hypothetical protein BKA70DRAFT_1533993 [Coprinopsis sp. MPI-PUGE-AT-0042]
MPLIFTPLLLLSACASIALGVPRNFTDSAEPLISQPSIAIGGAATAISTRTGSVPSEDECPSQLPSGTAIPTTAFASGSTIYFLPVQTVTVTYYPSSCPTVSDGGSTLPSFVSSGGASISLRPTEFTTRPTGLMNSESEKSMTISPPLPLSSRLATATAATSGASTTMSRLPTTPTSLPSYFVPGGGSRWC